MTDDITQQLTLNNAKMTLKIVDLLTQKIKILKKHHKNKQHFSISTLKIASMIWVLNILNMHLLKLNDDIEDYKCKVDISKINLKKSSKSKVPAIFDANTGTA